MSDEQRLFAYGTLRNPEVQARVIGRTAPSEPAALAGWRKEWIEVRSEAAEIAGEEVHPIAVPDPEGEIEGLVLSVTERDWPALDDSEGEPYERVAVLLTDGRGAWFYAARA